MNHKHMLLTIFLLCAFFLHTATIGFAVDSEEEPTAEQEAAKEAYRDSLINLDMKNDKQDRIKNDVDDLVDSIEKIENGAREAELASLLITAAAFLSGAAAADIVAKTAAAIVGSKNTVDIVLGAIETQELTGTVQELLRGLYNLETELIKQNQAVQTQAEKVNTKLKEWEATLPEGETPVFDDEAVEPIDVETWYPDQTRSLTDPPYYPSDTTETIACPKCSGAPETASARKLDPQTQLKVDKLYAESDRLSAEADMSSNMLYAESEELQKENDAIIAEIEKRRQMRRDPNVDKETYKTFDEALDARVRAATAEYIRLNELHKEHLAVRDESMRLFREAKALEGK